MSACFCVGPAGDCPCLRRAKRLAAWDGHIPPMWQSYVQKPLKPRYKLRTNGERILVGLPPLLLNAR